MIPIISDNRPRPEATHRRAGDANVETRSLDLCARRLKLTDALEGMPVDDVPDRLGAVGGGGGGCGTWVAVT
jgi:hypothetical protein